MRIFLSLDPNASMILNGGFFSFANLKFIESRWYIHNPKFLNFFSTNICLYDLSLKIINFKKFSVGALPIGLHIIFIKR